MPDVNVLNDLASLGAAGVMGAMWLWERRASRQRDQQLTDAHERIARDEQRLGQLVQVVEHNTAALTRFADTQQSLARAIGELRQEVSHAAS